jgi:hypothetical protein
MYVGLGVAASRHCGDHRLGMDGGYPSAGRSLGARQVLQEEKQLSNAFGEGFASRAAVPRYLPHPKWPYSVGQALD